jgi:hypothetical protein
MLKFQYFTSESHLQRPLSLATMPFDAARNLEIYASAFMHVRQELFFSKKMSHNHPLYEQLSLFDLFCLYSGDEIFEQMTMGYKLKHSFK